MRKIDEIIVHCTATRADWWATRTSNQKVAEVRKWHTSPPNNWKDIGYHFLIDRDGTVVAGRPVEEVGAHVQGHNATTIGVSLFGGHGSNATDSFDDHFTLEQDLALRHLIEVLREKYPSIKKVSGHNEYARKACPGFNVRNWLESKKERTNVAQSTTVQASAVQLAAGVGGGLTALGALDGHAQIIALVFAGVIIVAAAWVMRERIRKWAAGDR